MKKLLSLIILFCALAVHAQQVPKSNPAIKRFVYQKQTGITKRVYDSIYFDIAYDPAKTWVFKYSYRAAEQEMIADDEYFESYEFEMAPPKGNSFVIGSEDFEKHKVIFNRSCFCPDAGLRQLQEGRITGKKVGKDTWLLTFDLMINPRPGRDGLPTPKKFKGYFKPGKLVY